MLPVTIHIKDLNGLVPNWLWILLSPFLELSAIDSVIGK